MIVVRHRDGSLHSTPFNVRFGRAKLWNSRDKVVQVEVNGEMTSAVMKIGKGGEAYWLQPTYGHFRQTKAVAAAKMLSTAGTTATTGPAMTAASGSAENDSGDLSVTSVTAGDMGLPVTSSTDSLQPAEVAAWAAAQQALRVPRSQIEMVEAPSIATSAHTTEDVPTRLKANSHGDLHLKAGADADEHARPLSPRSLPELSSSSTQHVPLLQQSRDGGLTISTSAIHNVGDVQEAQLALQAMAAAEKSKLRLSRLMESQDDPYLREAAREAGAAFGDEIEGLPPTVSSTGEGGVTDSTLSTARRKQSTAHILSSVVPTVTRGPGGATRRISLAGTPLLRGRTAPHAPGSGVDDTPERDPPSVTTTPPPPRVYGKISPPSVADDAHGKPPLAIVAPGAAAKAVEGETEEERGSSAGDAEDVRGGALKGDHARRRMRRGSSRVLGQEDDDEEEGGYDDDDDDDAYFLDPIDMDDFIDEYGEEALHQNCSFTSSVTSGVQAEGSVMEGAEAEEEGTVAVPIGTALSAGNENTAAAVAGGRSANTKAPSRSAVQGTQRSQPLPPWTPSQPLASGDGPASGNPQSGPDGSLNTAVAAEANASGTPFLVSASGLHEPQSQQQQQSSAALPSSTPASAQPPAGAAIEGDYEDEEYAFAAAAAAAAAAQNYFTRTLLPVEEDLRKLNLREGCNQVRYLAYRRAGDAATIAVTCNIFLWDYRDKIVVSDVDGTITKSDLWGHFYAMIGKGGEWTHPGICSLYSKIEHNGYRMVYLTARSVSQIDQTKNYLWTLEQDGVRLPLGPVLTAPQRFFSAFKQEVSKQSHVFKIACLKGVLAAFPSHTKPFFAGFGNRYNDVISYDAAGVPTYKIFIIDPSSVLHVCRVKHTYRNLAHLVDMTFPPVARHAPHRHSRATAEGGHCANPNSANGGHLAVAPGGAGGSPYSSDLDDEGSDRDDVNSVLNGSDGSVAERTGLPRSFQDGSQDTAEAVPAGSGASSVSSVALTVNGHPVYHPAAFTMMTNDIASALPTSVTDRYNVFGPNLAPNAAQSGGKPPAGMSATRQTSMADEDVAADPEFDSFAYWRVDPRDLISSPKKKSETASGAAASASAEAKPSRRAVTPSSLFQGFARRNQPAPPVPTAAGITATGGGADGFPSSPPTAQKDNSNPSAPSGVAAVTSVPHPTTAGSYSTSSTVVGGGERAGSSNRDGKSGTTSSTSTSPHLPSRGLMSPGRVKKVEGDRSSSGDRGVGLSPLLQPRSVADATSASAPEVAMGDHVSGPRGGSTAASPRGGETSALPPLSPDRSQSPATAASDARGAASVSGVAIPLPPPLAETPFANTAKAMPAPPPDARKRFFPFPFSRNRSKAPVPSSAQPAADTAASTASADVSGSGVRGSGGKLSSPNSAVPTLPDIVKARSHMHPDYVTFYEAPVTLSAPLTPPLGPVSPVGGDAGTVEVRVEEFTATTPTTAAAARLRGTLVADHGSSPADDAASGVLQGTPVSRNAAIPALPTTTTTPFALPRADNEGVSDGDAGEAPAQGRASSTSRPPQQQKPSPQDRSPETTTGDREAERREGSASVSPTTSTPSPWAFWRKNTNSSTNSSSTASPIQKSTAGRGSPQQPAASFQTPASSAPASAAAKGPPSANEGPTPPPPASPSNACGGTPTGVVPLTEASSGSLKSALSNAFGSPSEANQNVSKLPIPPPPGSVAKRADRSPPPHVPAAAADSEAVTEPIGAETEKGEPEGSADNGRGG